MLGLEKLDIAFLAITGSGWRAFKVKEIVGYALVGFKIKLWTSNSIRAHHPLWLRKLE
jgi:hypothetical protein